MSERLLDLNKNHAEPSLRSLHGELVLLVAAQAQRAALPVYCSSAIVVALVATYVPIAYAAAWLTVVWLATAAHTSVITRLPDDASRSDNRKLTIAAISFALHGLLLGSLLPLFFAAVPIVAGSALTIYNVGICAATVPATAGFRRIFLPYAIVTLVPIPAAWLLFPVHGVALQERLILSGMALIYMVALLGHAKGSFKVFTESYNMRLERLDLNQRLREALGKAEAASQAKTRFLASASHDLRQPIHALSLFSGALLLRTLDARTTAIAEQLDKSVKVLASQLDGLLDISRLDAGVIEKSMSGTDLNAVLFQLVEEFRPLADRKGLSLSLACPGALYVWTDALLLQRILRNLLSNAIKYTETGRVEVSVKRQNSYCSISVRDTGLGIPETEHDRVFEEFYQLHNSERDRTKGLGLGLAIVRRLTELLDMNLNLESTPGQGSRFSISGLTIVRPEAKSLELAPPTELLSTPIHILVVDDEEDVRNGMSTLLEQMGFRVAEASSTENAMESARQVMPSIVLADFRLRGEDNGVHTIKSLRSTWPDLPALLISGDTKPDRLREAHEAGIELLHKPVNATVLRDSIIKALS